MENKFDKYEYDKKYHAEKYDRLNVVFKKGFKEQIKAAADREGKSMNGFIVEAIIEAIKKRG